MADYPISNVPRRVQYVNSGVGPYAFTFEILVQTDIAVYRGNTLLTLTTDYSVTINANGTGSITLVAAGTGNITIVGARAIQRSSDYTTGGDLFASTLNTDLDSQTIYSQQLAETLDRTIKVPITDASTLNMQLPSSTVRANKVFAFGANGAPQVSTNTLAAIDAAVDTIESIASAPAGNSAGISHISAGSGAVATTVQAKLRQTVSVKDFGAVGNNVADDTAEIQAAFNYCMLNGSRLHIPAGTYKTTATLNISSNITILGDGNQQSVINFYASATTDFAIAISVPDNAAIRELTISGIKINCNAGAAVGSGISTATTSINSAITQSELSDIFINNVTVGVKLDGVVYMSKFDRIVVSGGVNQYGWYAPNSLNQLLYNSFTNMEVTNVNNGAFAYYMSLTSCRLTNITCDGCCYFEGFYTYIDGLSVENIHATTVPAQSAVIKLEQIAALENVGIINVPDAKFTYAIDYFGDVFLNNVYIPNLGAANQPSRPLIIYNGGNGTVNNFRMPLAATSPIDNYTAQSILNGYIITNCFGITNSDGVNLSYGYDTWTPGFAGWATAPTVISAQYTKIGRQVTATLYCQDGITAANGIITGLPFAANSAQGSGAYGGNNDTTERISGSVLPSQTRIENIPALTLTGNFWQITTTYFT